MYYLCHFGLAELAHSQRWMPALLKDSSPTSPQLRALRAITMVGQLYGIVYDLVMVVETPPTLTVKVIVTVVPDGGSPAEGQLIVTV